MKTILGSLLLLVIVACTPVVPGPGLTPDRAAAYEHPSGVFSLELPPGWAVGDLSDGPQLLVTFAPPQAARVLLTAFVVHLGAPPDEAAFRGAMESYLRSPYNQSLSPVERAAMGDGSWRLTGVRHGHGESTPVNLFMQRDGAFFSALEAVVPDDPLTGALLETMLNSYRVNPAADWPVGAVEAVPQPAGTFILAGGNMAFSGLLTWTGEDGRLHVTGRVANRAPYPLDRIQVRAALYDSAGTVVAEGAGSTPVTVLLDGEYAPFEVAFDAGRPPAAVRLGLWAEAQPAVESLAAFYGPGAFDWDDRAEYDDAGQLHIRGTVWNVGSQTAHAVRAIITLFDAADQVAGYVTAGVGEGTLTAGASARFDAPVSRLGAEPTHYLVTVQGEIGP